MLDKKSISVLKALKILADDNSFKVVTLDDISSNLSQPIDIDTIKQTIDFLYKQEYINIKFSEDNTYCYSILPKTHEAFNQGAKVKSNKNKKHIILNYVFTALASFVGSLVALLVFFLILFR